MTDETTSSNDEETTAPRPDTSAQDGVEAAAEAAADEAAQSDSAVASETAAAVSDEFAEWKDRCLRTQAELENQRRRSQRDLEEERRYRSLPLLRDLLPAMDNLGRAVSSAEQSGDINNLLEGIRMVSRQFEDALKGHSAEPIRGDGEAFDPNLHEALTQVPSADHPPMTVLQVVEVGYKLHDRVVRPAKVIVSMEAPDSAPAADD